MASVRLAGHPPPLLLSGGSVVTVPARHGPVLGCSTTPRPGQPVLAGWPGLGAADVHRRAHRRPGRPRRQAAGHHRAAHADRPGPGRRGAPRAAGRMARRPGEQANDGPLADDVAMLLLTPGRPRNDPPELTGRQWTLRQRVTRCACCRDGAHVPGRRATTTAVANRGQLDRLLDQVAPMRAASTELDASLVDEEAAVRAYVLNAVPGDLNRLPRRDRGRGEPDRDHRRQPAATTADPGPLSEVSTATRQWRAQVAEPAIAARTDGDRVTAEALLNDPSLAQFSRVRQAVDDLQASMQVIRDEAVTSIKDTSTTLMFVLVVAVILVIASGVALILALQRTVIGPLTTWPRRCARWPVATTATRSPPPAARADAAGRRRGLDAPPDRLRPGRGGAGPASDRGDQRPARTAGVGASCAPTGTWSSSPTSPRTTCRSRCARWPASAAAAAALPGPAGRAGRPVHRGSRSTGAAHAAAHPRPAGVLADRPGHDRILDVDLDRLMTDELAPAGPDDRVRSAEVTWSDCRWCTARSRC